MVSPCSIAYCISENIITESDIKIVLRPAPEVAAPRDYFNNFIDDYQKLAVNTMIGGLKPKPR